jgi:hypothetical protein
LNMALDTQSSVNMPHTNHRDWDWTTNRTKGKDRAEGIESQQSPDSPCPEETPCHVMIFSTCIYIYPCFPFHYSQRAVLVHYLCGCCHTYVTRDWLLLHVQYNTTLFGCLGLWASRATWIQLGYCCVAQEHLSLHSHSTSLSGGCGWLWIGPTQ